MNSLFDQSSSSSMTRKRIPCSQMRSGMFLVRILDSWWRSPFFVHRRVVNTPEVQQLIQSGIQEVEIDTSKGLDVLPDSQPMPFHSIAENAQDPANQHDQEDSGTHEPRICSPDSESLGSENREQLVRLRADAVAALGDVFQGAKTGQTIPLPALYETARKFVQKALAHPTVLSEIMLIEHLEQFDKSLYSHVVDTAVLTILVGLQLDWDLSLLEEVAVAALLHDVGYMRLPLNLVRTRGGRTGIDCSLLQQHVDVGVTLLHRKSQFSPELVQMIREHHTYQDGSGYPQAPNQDSVSSSGKLLGLADYFDELLAGGNTSGSLPAALAIRRMYQEAQRGKFPILFMEAMIRVLGVYPVGTVVQLSTGEAAVVVKQNPEVSVKPQVKIIKTQNGHLLDESEVKNLMFGGDNGNEVSILKVLDTADSSVHLRQYFA